MSDVEVFNGDVDSTALPTETTESTAKPVEGQPAASEPAKTDAPAEPTMAEVLSEIRAMKALTGRIPDLASKLEKMPKSWESTLDKRFKESQTQSYINSLPQDQQEAYKQQLAAKEAQNKEIEALIEATLRKQNPNGLDEETVNFIKEQKAEKAVQADTNKFFTSIESSIGPDEAKQIVPYIDGFLKWHAQAINSGDEEAFKKASKAMDEALANPEKVALAGLKWLKEQNAQASGKVIDERQKKGASLALSPRGSAASSNGAKLNPHQMTAKELQSNPDIANMSTADYEKLLKASKQ